MRTIRAFAEGLSLDATHCTLDGPEAHHLLHVLRVKVGDGLQLFNGTGDEFEVLVERLSKKSVDCEVQSARTVSREASREIVVVSAVPKSDRQQALIEKLVELGARTWVAASFRHSALAPDAKSLERWRRYVIEASKQCRRNWLMGIELWSGACDFQALIQQLRSGDVGGFSSPSVAAGCTAWVLDPSGVAAGSSWFDPTRAGVVAVGPEGGFAESELNQARESGWEVVGWGDRILRLETAAWAATASLLGPSP